MAVTRTAPIQTYPGTWTIGFTSDLGSPTFYVYYQSTLYAQTTDTSVIVDTGSSTEPNIEVYDDPATIASQVRNPGWLSLTWYSDPATTTATTYRVESYVSGEWRYAGSIAEAGSGYYQFITPHLDDVATANYRVIPVDASGRDGTAKNYTAFVVRHPNTPSSSFSRASNGSLTVS